MARTTRTTARRTVAAAAAALGCALLAAPTAQARDIAQTGSPLTSNITHDSQVTQARYISVTAFLADLDKTSSPKPTTSATMSLSPEPVDYVGSRCSSESLVLQRDLQDVRTDPHDACEVTSGTLTDPYTGQKVAYAPGKVVVAPVVTPAYAKSHGADLTPAEQSALVSDPMNLLATTPAAVRAKGDAGLTAHVAGGAYAPGGWLPADKAFDRAYMVRFAAVAMRYALQLPSTDITLVKKELTMFNGAVDLASSDPHRFDRVAAMSTIEDFSDDQMAAQPIPEKPASVDPGATPPPVVVTAAPAGRADRATAPVGRSPIHWWEVLSALAVVLALAGLFTWRNHRVQRARERALLRESDELAHERVVDAHEHLYTIDPDDPKDEQP